MICSEGKNVRPASPAKLLSTILAGSWRREPPRPEFDSSELAGAVGLLVGSGAAALAWWKIRRAGMSGEQFAGPLRQSYRTQALQVALREREVESVFKLLRSESVEPILMKGRAAALLYPEPGLRPPGDIDLLVRPEDRARAKLALRGATQSVRAYVDFTHSEFAGDENWRDEVFGRSRLVRLGETPVRVLGPEDHLRFLCLHFLRHSAYRPLWLCDIAAALEAAPPDFDWHLLLGEDATKRNWVACALDLSRLILGAREADAPVWLGAARAPGWLAEEVLRQWEKPRTADHLPRELMAVSLRNPVRALPALAARWPGPIQAAVGLRRPFHRRPGLSLKASYYLLRSARFLSRAAGRDSAD
jgi:hypothetical protein